MSTPAAHFLRVIYDGATFAQGFVLTNGNYEVQCSDTVKTIVEAVDSLFEIYDAETGSPVPKEVVTMKEKLSLLSLTVSSFGTNSTGELRPSYRQVRTLAYCFDQIRQSAAKLDHVGVCLNRSTASSLSLLRGLIAMIKADLSLPSRDYDCSIYFTAVAVVIANASSIDEIDKDNLLGALVSASLLSGEPNWFTATQDLEDALAIVDELTVKHT